MTRKDYVKFAHLVRELQRDDLGHSDTQIIHLYKELFNIFLSDNSNFSKQKFIDASFSRKTILDEWRVGRI
jgi:hypothetical protein